MNYYRDIELWNGKRVVGSINIGGHLMGKSVIVNYTDNEKHRTVSLPIVARCLSDNGIEYCLRRCLSVKGINKKRLEIMLAHLQLVYVGPYA